MERSGLEEFLIYVCLVLYLFSFILLLSMFESSAYAGSTIIALSPQSIAASVGQSFSVNVTVTNVTDPYGLYGWEFRLNWTASILSVSNIAEGSFLKSGGGTTFFSNSFNNVVGHMIVDCTLEGSANGVRGSGVLATLTFYVIGTGQSALDLYNATLLDANGVEIPCQVVSGYGNFTSSTDSVNNVNAVGRIPYES
jgi:hypothetical protein